MLQQTKNQELNDIIRKIKFLTNLKQSQIAEKIGVSSSYLSDVINERYPFTDKLRVCLYEKFPNELGAITDNSNNSGTINYNSGNVNGGKNNTINHNSNNGNNTELKNEIKSLNKLIETKDSMITELKERLKDKGEIIEMLKEKIEKLKVELSQK